MISLIIPVYDGGSVLANYQPQCKNLYSHILTRIQIKNLCRAYRRGFFAMR